MNICVAGLWHLGSVTAACMASRGHRVVGFDTDAAVVENLKRGIAPVFEPGLEDLIKQGVSSAALRFTSALQDLADAEVLWITYDTPFDEHARADPEFVTVQVERLLEHLHQDACVVISSQLPAGSIRKLASRYDAAHDGGHGSSQLHFASAPENLRLGKALVDFLEPDRIVVGVSSEEDKSRLLPLFVSISDRIEWMSVESAEMTKHAINAYLATSVAFANEIAVLCESVGADAKAVERGLKTDGRIGGRAYLSPGAAFSGGTLARDIEFLTGTAQARSVVTPLLDSVTTSNEHHKRWIQRQLERHCGTLAGLQIAIWGLTYKPGTDTLRGSAAVELCDWLLERSTRVKVHDPNVKLLPEKWAGAKKGCVERYDDPLTALKGASVLVVATEWPSYKEFFADMVAGRNDSLSDDLLIIDPNRFLSDLVPASTKLRYLSVGTPQFAQPPL